MHQTQPRQLGYRRDSAGHQSLSLSEKTILMGLVYNNFRVFLSARRQGASFVHTLTLGRQQMYVSGDEVRRLAGEFPEYILDPEQTPATGEYCENWLRAWLGCESVQSIDASSYEGATLVHDMNLPIPQSWEAQFSAVIDGGSIEHIYFATVAIANAMKLTRVGGWLFIASVANNHCGHGFYQFSPEWFFRTLSSENGFRLGDVLLMPHPYPGTELSSNNRLYRVTDPARNHARVGLVNSEPVLILVSACRLEETELFRRPPQQSDYTEKWLAAENSSLNLPTQAGSASRRTLQRILGGVGRRLRRGLPKQFDNYLQGRSQRQSYSLSNNKVFEPWTPAPAIK